ncbi:bifunctional methionine sulfoxide reductase B/A protein [Lentisphaera profundi]|uniref:Peptide methionine sulfoxide reductase MsrA n=1 Tax=Lentisphaera profundi TaxID=1658616 RepID=A0ABY7VWD1_9BACT|nr:bifunctional methionine sulfoxide reductase B/A protein [Lentisphaera profundi]WDE98032.1 bifunctional methionine sulfoxide reductase B/A protein [Lentisphaera profundi]
MKNILIIISLIFSLNTLLAETNTPGASDKGNKAMPYNKLTAEEAYVIEQKGTERPFTGEYDKNKASGTYICRKCNTPLYESKDKFDSRCGWPSFDDEIKDAVKHKTDADGRRTEILCQNCDGHLGHVFSGEGFTPKDTRHCVNSLSMKFIAEGDKLPTPIPEPKKAKAIFASGCFWGTEYWLQQVPGVISATSGYIGGHVDNPTYKQVCSGLTGHYEAVEVVYNPEVTNFEALAKIYFETHNSEQANGQGPDIGTQYLPAVFYFDDEQKATIEKLIQTLKDKGYKPATEIKKTTTFWPAEAYHQDYYFKTRKTPYCHKYKKIF